jgi:hypothetical protein
MLRKACQPILNDFDLDAFHADLDPGTKSMRIFTPCGKLFATVSGVQFGGLNPTKAEIEFSTELLTNWLQRNASKIEKYLEEFEVLQRMPPYRLEVDNIEVECSTQWVSRKQNSRITGIRCVTITQDKVVFTVNNHGEVTKVDIREPITYPADYALTITADNYQKAMALLAEAIALSDQERLVEHLVAVLNTCES